MIRSTEQLQGGYLVHLDTSGWYDMITLAYSRVLSELPGMFSSLGIFMNGYHENT
jgi:hypothetical protein